MSTVSTLAPDTATQVKKSIKGTRTEANVLMAYMNESTAYTRYTYFAQQANKEKLYPIEQIFKDTAANELHHGKVFLRMLEGGSVNLSMSSDASTIGSTADNLKTAIEEEHDEGVVAYTEAARVALEEGFPEIAEHFSSIASIELHHKERFQRYLYMLNAGTLWKRPKPIKWQCLVCGFIFTGTEPPEKCPACDHPREHYMAMEDVTL